MPPLNLHHLRLFSAVAEDGTLTGAARRLNLSASALSAQVKALEGSLGHDLFERRGRGLVLTEAGRIALDHAQAIFRTAEDLSATLKGGGQKPRALRVGALSTLSRNLQIQFLISPGGRSEWDKNFYELAWKAHKEQGPLPNNCSVSDFETPVDAFIELIQP